MQKSEALHRMRQTGLVPVLRGSTMQEALSIARAIAAGGVNILEVTMTVPGALQIIRTLLREEPGILVGAGTVLDPETARTCILEGAQFIVSPATNPATIELCQRYSIAVLPGALTPTEVVTAWQAGADVVKVFPCSAMGGASYLKSLKAPLPHIDLIPTGGVSIANAGDFLRAGAFALGVGADLADPRAIASGTPHTITETARNYLRAIADFRAGSADAQSD